MANWTWTFNFVSSIALNISKNLKVQRLNRYKPQSSGTKFVN